MTLIWVAIFAVIIIACLIYLMNDPYL